MPAKARSFVYQGLWIGFARAHRFGVSDERLGLRRRLGRGPHLDGVVAAPRGDPAVVHGQRGDATQVARERAARAHRAVGLVAHRGVDLPQPDLRGRAGGGRGNMRRVFPIL